MKMPAMAPTSPAMPPATRVTMADRKVATIPIMKDPFGGNKCLQGKLYCASLQVSKEKCNGGIPPGVCTREGIRRYRRHTGG